MDLTENKYTRDHSSPQEDALAWIEKQTHVHTNYPQMLSGPVLGRLLRILIESTGASRVLELGCFTGYSSASMALSLPEGGHIDALEINDEMEDLIREGWRRAGVEDRITLRIGDALQTLKTLPANSYDLAYIDANKREYKAYLEGVKPLLKRGGLLIADDTLLGGKVYGDHPATDAQTTGLKEFNDAIAADRDFEVTVLPLGDGLTIARKTR